MHGRLEVGGAKNAVLKLLAAALLTDQPVHLTHVPRIEDVSRMIELLQSVGAKVTEPAHHELLIEAAELNVAALDDDLVGKFRASALLMGALLSRIGEVKLPGPGGDTIGARSLAAHLDIFRQLGVDVQDDGRYYHLRQRATDDRQVVLSEISVTATENAILGCALGSRTVTIRCAATDHSVQELCWFVRAMGLQIEGVGTSTLIIHGAASLHGVEKYQVMPDPVEAATFIALAAATRSTIDVIGVPYEFLTMELAKFTAANVNFELGPLHPHPQQPYHLVDVRVSPSTQLRAIPHLHNMPYPGLIPDVLPPMTVLLTQATGTSLIHDWMYEGRLKYVDELNLMGAQIFVADPHRILVTGPVPLYGAKIKNNDIRAGASLLIAALLASGTSVLDPVYPLDRGYERLDLRLQAIGAKIERLDDQPSSTVPIG